MLNPRQAEEHEPASSLRHEIAVKAQQPERNAVRRQRLDVAHRDAADGTEGERQAREKSRVIARGQSSDEQEDGHSRKRPREEQRQVVREQRVAGQPIDRARDRVQSEQVLRERGDALGGKIVRGAPPLF